MASRRTSSNAALIDGQNEYVVHRQYRGIDANAEKLNVRPRLVQRVELSRQSCSRGTVD